jgi:hypothetical protein
MSHICANDEYRSQVGATNRPKNIVIRYSRLSAYKVVDVFSFHLQIFSLIYRSALAQIFPRSQPTRESNTSAYDRFIVNAQVLEAIA